MSTIKTIAAILTMASMTLAINSYSLQKRYVQGDTVTASNLTGNLDSGQVWSVKVADTLNASARLAGATFTGTVSVDSAYSSKSFKGKRVITDSGTVPILTGSVITRGTATVDSLKSTKGVNATGGTFSSAVTVDSLKSTKGVNATRGTFSSAMLDSLKFGSGSWLTKCLDTSWACTLYDGSTYRAHSTASAYRIGRIVLIKVPELLGTITATTATKISPLPAGLMSASGSFAFIAVSIVEKDTCRPGIIYPNSYTNNFTLYSTNKYYTDIKYLTAGFGGILESVFAIYY